MIDKEENGNERQMDDNFDFHQLKYSSLIITFQIMKNNIKTDKN